MHIESHTRMGLVFGIQLLRAARFIKFYHALISAPTSRMSEGYGYKFIFEGVFHMPL